MAVVAVGRVVFASSVMSRTVIVREMPDAERVKEIRPIRSEADYEAVLAEVERLWGAAGGSPEGDRLDILATLIVAYEAQRFPFDPPDPIDAIRFRMEHQGLSRRDLEPLIGTRSRVAEVLNRRRGLSLSMIRRLHEARGIPLEILVRPMRTDQAV